MTAAEIEASNCSGNSGPYRRVWSKTGFSWMSATIYLPSRVTGEIRYGADPLQGDTAYVYAGGWGAGGDRVDAGFLHNTGQDDWSPFLRFQGLPFLFDADDRRFLGGQEVQLKFWIPADNTLMLTAEGNTTDAGEASITLGLGPADGVHGWGPAGVDQVLQRMTSIAQNAQDFSSGSFLINVHWRNVQIGTSAADAVRWLSTQTGGQCMHPADPSRVRVNFVTEAEETDHITLT